MLYKTGYNPHMTIPSIILLTHERELSKPTSTAHCAMNVLPTRIHRILWQRTDPDRNLLAILKHERVGLVYPNPENETQNTNVTKCDYWVILDGTWQEARKMFNRSPYLHNLPRIQLIPKKPSQYILRRNQKTDGLSTAECIAQLLNENNEVERSNQVLNEFTHFNLR